MSLLYVAIRTLIRDWKFTVSALPVLAVTLGGGLAAFTLFDVFRLQPPSHVTQSEQLLHFPEIGSFPSYVAANEYLESVDLAGFATGQVSLGKGVDARWLRVQCVTDGFFDVLNVKPKLGQFFRRNRPPAIGQTAVISSRLADSIMSGNQTVIGSTIHIAGRLHQVIGVAPDGFAGVEFGRVDAWVLISSFPEACSTSGRSLLARQGGSWLTVLGRIRANFTLRQVEAEVQARAQHEPTAGEGTSGAFVQTLQKYRTQRSSRDGRVADWLVLASLLLLLVAVCNLAFMLSVRTHARRSEVAIRLQLGARPSTVIQAFVVEALVFVLITALVSLVPAVWFSSFLTRFFGLGKGLNVLSLEPILMLIATTLVMAILSALVPAVQVVRRAARTLQVEPRGTLSPRSAFRDVVLLVQVALAFFLAAGAVLFLRSASNVRKDLGYESEGLIVAAVVARGLDLPDPAIRSAYDMLANRVATVPKVRAVALSSGSMVNVGGPISSVQVRNRGSGVQRQAVVTAVSQGYFRVAETLIVEGREFDGRDTTNGERVAVVDHTLARLLWPGQNALGQCLSLGAVSCVRVVGLSKTRRSLVITRASNEVFIPLTQSPATPGMLLIRVSPPATGVLEQVAGVLRSTSEDIPFVRVEAASDAVDTQAGAWLLGSTVLGFFAAIAGLLVGAGVFASVALHAYQRRAEIGLRMALGSPTASVIALTAGRAVAVVFAGLCVGLAGSLLAAKSLQHLFFGVVSHNPYVLIGAGLIVLMCATLGAIVPAFAATRTDPVTALRCHSG